MKKIVFFFICIWCAASLGWAQSSRVEKAIKKAMTFQNMTIVYENEEKTQFHFLYHVDNCSFGKDEVRTFPNYCPEYTITQIDVENVYNWGYYDETVVAFDFYRNDPPSNMLEVAVQLANKNDRLQVSYLNAAEAYSFFQKYVKPFPELAKIYQKQFLQEFVNYVKNNPDGMIQFCEGSPYVDNGLLKDINVWQLLEESKKTSTPYVYYLDANKGYVVDEDGSYTGEIRNGLAEGNGVLNNGQGKWVGTFKNGKMNGAFTNTQSLSLFEAKLYMYEGSFTQECKGTCVDGEWDGEVVKTTTTQRAVPMYIYSLVLRCDCGDVEKLHYSNGKLQSSEKVSDCMTSSLDEEVKQRIAARNAMEEAMDRKQREIASMVDEHNIANYVRSIDYDQEYAGNIYYDVKFENGVTGYLIYKPSASGIWKWGYSTSGGTEGFFNPYTPARSREDALVNLYRQELLEQSRYR